MRSGFLVSIVAVAVASVAFRFRTGSFVPAVVNHCWMPSTMVHLRSAAVVASLRCFVSFSMNWSRQSVLEWQRYKCRVVSSWMHCGQVSVAAPLR